MKTSWYATAISEIDRYTFLRDKPGDTQTRDLIEYVKTRRQETLDEVKGDRSSLATRDDLARFLNKFKQEMAGYRAETKQNIFNLRTDMEKGFKEQLR